MPNRAIEIHDSILASISIAGGRAELHFNSVYVHQSEGVPGVDVGSGWVQEAILRIYNVEVKGVFSEFPVDLASGQTRIGEQHLDNEIPVPLHHEGAFELRLEAMWKPGEVVSFTGSGAELELLGEPEYVDEFRATEQS